jgi:hypothetical protein
MRRIAALMILVLAAACSDEGPVSAPGTLNAAVVGPNGDEGAALIMLLGDGIEGVSPAGGTEVYVSSGDSQTRIVLIHPTGGDLEFELAVADVTDPPAWVIEEVVGVDDSVRADLSAYSLELSR